MTRSHLIFAALAWLVLVGIAGFEARLITHQRQESTALRHQAAGREATIALLRRDRDAVAADLTQAERQLAALPEPDPSITPQRHAEMKAWLARMKQLQQLFAENPGQRIPEMQLLLDDDWLRIAKKSRLDSDDARRNALAEVRGNAVARFAAHLRAAVRRYAQTGKNEMPASGLSFASYFEPSVDLAMLERYEVVPAPARPPSRLSKLVAVGATAEWLVQNKTAIDADHDYRYQVGSDGATSASFGVMAWTPGLRERHREASKAYAQANNGVLPARIAEVLPYFNPPLEPSVAGKLIKAYSDYRR